MGTNLLHNYIAAKSQPMPTSAPKPKPDFDIQSELDNRTFIKPLRGRGKLINGNIFSTPKVVFDDFIYNSKAFKHALTGNANDHELGKLNDVGLMLGGLGIASYLMTRRNTPLRKGMEFVGFGAFIASMEIWPKLAIQLPAYLIHGVNVKKEYQDSFGRRKPFYQDPQFIPWDLYSDEEIDKIGDRLGVPKDIQNRRDFVQERMRKLAIQNNTLWMLTAGVATPVMTGLICNGLENYLQKRLSTKRNKEADAIIANVENYSKKYQSKDIYNELNNIIEKYDGKQITPEMVQEINEIFTQDLDLVSSKSFERDLKVLMGSNEYSIGEQTAKNISKNLTEMLKNSGKYSEEFISAIIPNESDMVELFKNNDLMKNTKEVDFNKAQTAIIREMINRYRSMDDKKVSAQEFGNIRTKILGKDTKEHPIRKAMMEIRSQIFDKPLQEKLGSIANVLDAFRAKVLTLDEYVLLKVGAAPETIIANYWKDVSDTVLKEMGFSYKEIEKVKFNQKLMGQLLREKMETIAADKTKYEHVMTKLAEKIASLDSLIKPSDISTHTLKGEGHTAYEEAVDQVFDSAAKSLRDAHFSETADALAGVNGDLAGSAKNIQKAYAEERLLGVKSSFNRLLNTFDFFRRISTDPNKFEAYENRYVPREVREELIEACKRILLEGHSSDFATKFYTERNPNPNLSDNSKIEIVNGRPKFNYVNNPDIQRTDIPGDKTFFQDAMKMMFEDDIHPETKAILEKVQLSEEMANYRSKVLDVLGGDDYFWKPRHVNRKPHKPGSDLKFLLTGISPEEFFFKSGQTFYNTKKWFRMFGAIGAGLLGVTILAQFFLGKIKNPQKVGQR